MPKFYGPVLIKDFEFVKKVVRAHEGFKLKAYNPGDKNPTTANGFNLNRRDAAVILKACGIPHKLDDLKKTIRTLTPDQAERLENYVLNEAAIIAASRLGGERFTGLNAAQQAAAISLATNSPLSMKDVASFMKEGKWNDNYLQDKVTAAEERDEVTYTGLRNRYTEIQRCLKEGDFSKKFYKSYKINPSEKVYNTTPPLAVARVPAAAPHPVAAVPVPPAVADNKAYFRRPVDTSPSLLTAKQLNYFSEIRERAFAMASAVNGTLGDTLKRQAMQIGMDVRGNPIDSIMGMIQTGIAEFSKPNSKAFVSDLKSFTKQGYHLLNGLSENMFNIANCVGLGSQRLGFDEKKLDELAQPFLRTATYYQTVADSLFNIHEVFNKEGIGDLQQPILKFNNKETVKLADLPNKIKIAEHHLTRAKESLQSLADSFEDTDESAKDWSRVFHGASTAINENTNCPESFTKNGSSKGELRSSEKNKSLSQTVDTLQYSVQLFGSVMQAIGKSDVASSVMAIAVPALNVASILCTWGTITAASGPAAPYVALAGALVMLGIGIASLFKGPEGPTHDEIIMRQFERLSVQIDLRFDRLEKFIDELAKHMDKRFEEIRQLIINSHQLTIDAIMSLHNDMNQGFATLLARVLNIQKSLDGIAQRHHALFTEAYTREFNQLLSFSGHATTEQKGQGLNPDSKAARHDYLDFHRRFYAFLSKESASNTLAGATVLTSGNETHELASALKRAYNPADSLGYESSINAIAAYVRTMDPKNPNIPKDALVNPLLWSQAAIGFIKFITNNPGFLYGHKTIDDAAKKLQHTQLQEIIGKGRTVANFLLACQKSPEFWEKIITNYKNALRDFLVEMYSIQWPATAEAKAFTENAEITLEHVAALKMIDKVIEDYIQGRAGPAAANNLFHQILAVPEQLDAKFPNPGYHILPNLLVHILRASEVRFHAANHMRTVGREIERPYLGVPAADESNGACEESLKRVHRDFNDEVNRVRSDGNPGGTLHYQFAIDTKQKIQEHQGNWTNHMLQLRNIPTQLRNDHANADRYMAALLNYSSAKMAHTAQDSKAALPDRAVIKKAYDIHQNAALPALASHDALLRKLEALDDSAYLIKFFVSLLFPARVEILAYFDKMLWDRERIVSYNSPEPLAIVLQNLLEREHPRLPTHLENFKTDILSQVEALKDEGDLEDQLQYIQPNLLHVLRVFKQFESLYFEVPEEFNRLESLPDFSNLGKNGFFSTPPSDHKTDIPETDSGFKVWTTKGEGDCGFHAALGEWNGKQFECKDIVGARARVAQAVEDFKAGKIRELALVSIEALVMGGDREVGRHIKKLQEEYQEHVRKQGDSLNAAWKTFEDCLNHQQDIVEYINDSVNIEEKSNPDPKRNLNTLRAKFNFCLNIKRDNAGDTLTALIQSNETLNAVLQKYNQEAKRGFNLDARINGDIIQDYAKFIARPTQWLLPHELDLIARVNGITIELYTPDAKKGPFNLLNTYNPGKEVRKVRFDGHGHYERITDNQPAAMLAKGRVGVFASGSSTPRKAEIPLARASGRAALSSSR